MKPIFSMTLRVLNIIRHRKSRRQVNLRLKHNSRQKKIKNTFSYTLFHQIKLQEKKRRTLTCKGAP